MDTPMLADQEKLTFINWADTGCCLKDLQRLMINKDGCQERESREFMLSVCLDVDKLY